jgi:hypothetical protein
MVEGRGGGSVALRGNRIYHDALGRGCTDLSSFRRVRASHIGNFPAEFINSSTKTDRDIYDYRLSQSEATNF